MLTAVRVEHRMPHRARVYVLIWLLLVSGGSAQTRPDERASVAEAGVWEDLIIPGGAPHLLARAGIPASIERWRAVPAVIEQFYGGMNARIPREFSHPRPSTSNRQHDSHAPLPLGHDFWTRVVGPAVAPDAMLAAILASRASASLYYGLLCLDSSTLQTVRNDPALAAVLIRYAEHLPVHAKAIRVHGGRIEPPGGETLAALWEDLVGRLDRPVEFVETLLTRDDGRLGYFYNTLDALTPPAVLFVAGPSQLSPRERREHFRALYKAFSAALPAWHGRQRRFFPMVGGPASALFALSFDRDGTLAGPPSRAFWIRALGERPPHPLDHQRPIDAAGLLTLLCSSSGCHDEKIHTLSFIQRQRDARSDANVDALVGAARARRLFPALTLELERMNLDAHDIYAEAAAVAARLDAIPRSRRKAALIQYQGAISLLRRMRETGMAADRVRAHLAALLNLPLHSDGYRGAVLRWLVVDVLDAETRDIDAAAARALSGEASPGDLLEWEGLRYQVDLAATEADRIRSVRARFDTGDLAAAWRQSAQSPHDADPASADAIATLVYSSVIQDPASPLALSRELPRRHDPFARVPGDPLPSSWTLPWVRMEPGGVRHIAGSLLALESGAPELARRRLEVDRPVDRARISPVLADGLWRTATLSSLWNDWSEQATRIVDAAERGSAIASETGRLERSLKSAGIAGPRAGWIRWANARAQPEVAAVLRLEDLVRLGAPGALKGIGAAAVPLDCACLQIPEVSWELRGQPSDHFVAAAVSVEPMFRVAHELQTRKLPTVLAPGILALLATDLVERSILAHPGDAHGIADSVRRVPSVRFDDYIAAITARGPLVPVSSASLWER